MRVERRAGWPKVVRFGFGARCSQPGLWGASGTVGSGSSRDLRRREESERRVLRQGFGSGSEG